MTMQQLSQQYNAQAVNIQQRLAYLRQQSRQATDPLQQDRLQQRIRALAQVTGHYYDRGYRHETYTF